MTQFDTIENAKELGFDHPDNDVSLSRGCNKWIGTIPG